MKQISLSCYELCEISAMFEQLTEGYEFESDEKRIECEFDYTQQFIDGVADPQVRYL